VKAGAELLRGGGGEPVRQEVSSRATRRAIASAGGCIRRPAAVKKVTGSTPAACAYLAVWISTSARLTVDMTSDTLPLRQGYRDRATVFRDEPGLRASVEPRQT
jgi:hypothetical protein